MVTVMCEKVVEMYVYAKYGASNCILLHRGHKVMMAGTSCQLFCRKTESFMLTLV